MILPTEDGTIGWGCRIYWLHLCRGVRLPQYMSWRYDPRQSDDEAPIILKLWGMWSTPSFPSLPGRLWPWVVAPDKGPIYGSNRTKLCCYTKLNRFKIELFWHLTVCKQKTILIIIIMSHHQHGYPWPFLTTLLYCP